MRQRRSFIFRTASALQPPGTLSIDVEEFEAAAAAALRSQNPAAYEAAIARYTGELLPCHVHR